MTPLKTNIANLVFPESLPVAARFELKNLKVTDLINGSIFNVGGSPDLDMLFTRFEFEGIVVKGTLYSRDKHRDRPTMKGSPENPGLMISTGDWSISLNRNQMMDREFNSRLVLYMTHMLAFRNSVCLSYGVFLWSDYSRRQAQVLAGFDMPSYDDLVKISTAWQDMRRLPPGGD